MTGEEDWEEPRLFLAEQTQAIRRELATLVVPVLVLAAAFAAVGLAGRDRGQLAAAPSLHASPIVDRR
jgi:hypothetical protein